MKVHDRKNIFFFKKDNVVRTTKTYRRMTTKRSKTGSERDKSIRASLETENNNKQKPE